MGSSKNSPIFDIISPLKSYVSHQLFESVQRDLCMRESRHTSEMNLLLHKLKKISNDHEILEKQLRQVRGEYGNLILRESEKSCELTELRRESGELRAENESKTRDYAELLRRNGELLRQLTESRLELKQLKHSSSELSGVLEKIRVENEELKKKGEETTSLEEKIRVWKEKFERAMKEVEAAKEKARREKDEVMNENAKLKMTKDAVIDAATVKFRRFEKRVAALEVNLANLKVTIDSSGEQRVAITQAKETLESIRPDEKLEVLVETQLVSGTTPPEENSASSLSCQPVISTVPVKVQQKSFGTNAKSEGLARCLAGFETMPSSAAKMASSKPSVTEKYSSTCLPICISDSDDDGEAKGLKRKLDFNYASDHSKTPLTAPKLCQQKITESATDVEVESVDSSTKQWEYEADMVDDLEKNPEICMRAICALYRQHITVGKSKGFSEIDAFRGMILGKFLVDGDIDGGLKKSLANLLDYDREGASKCRRIAMGHSSRLFEIYKNKEDPHFAPPH